MLFGILNRMIFWELVRVFALSVTGLTGLFLVVGIIQQATQFGLTPQQLIGIVPLLVPSLLPYTIPATMLFATCVVYGRLAHDNEAVALKAAGVDLLTMIRPAFLLGFLAAAGTAALQFTVIPNTQRMIQEEAIRDPEETLYNLLKRERCFRAPNMPYVLYVRDVQDRRLLDVVVKRRTSKEMSLSDEAFDYVARTREAELKIDLVANTLKVDSDQWVIKAPTSQVDSQDNKPFEIALPNNLRKDKLRESLRDRSQTIEWDLLPGRADEFAAEADKATRYRNVLLEAKPGQILTLDDQSQIAAANGMDAAQIPADPQDRAKQAGHFADVAKYHSHTSRTMLWEYYSRPALAMGCLLFGLIGCPIGLWANRADYLSIFVICWLPAVATYYPLVMSGGGLARDGKVPVPVGVWAANGVATVAAVLLMWRLIRR